MESIGTQLSKKLGLDPNQQLSDPTNIVGKLKTMQGKKPPVNTVNASQVGTAENFNIPTQRDTSRVDRANARIATTPDQPQSEIKSDDFFAQLFQESGIEPEMAGKFQQALNEASGGKFSQAGETVLQNLLNTQIDQTARKKEAGRLQERAGLPELQSELAGFESEFNTITAARDSRIINETGAQGTISKKHLADRQNEINRQYGLQVADNRINQLATAGKINAATQLIESSLDLKYGDLEAEIELYQSQLQAIAPFMSAEQSQLAEQRQFVLAQATNEINSARESEKLLKLQKVEALKNAQDRGATPLQMAQIQDANSLEQIASTGFMTSALEKSQLATESLKRQQISQDIASEQEAQTNAAVAREAGILNEDQAKLATDLRKEVNALPEVRSTKELEPNIVALLESLGKENGVADIAAINSFQRLAVDPGVAVREGDVALLQSAQSFGDKTFLKAQGLFKGNKLTDDARQQMRDLALDIYEARVNFTEDNIQPIRTTAEEAGIEYNKYIGRPFSTRQEIEGRVLPPNVSEEDSNEIDNIWSTLETGEFNPLQYFNQN
jgi:hypothetical protein